MIPPIGFDFPAWLLLLIPALGCVIYFTLSSRAGLPVAVQRLAMLLRSMAVVAIVLALAQMVHLSGGEGLSVLVLRDLSASVPRLVSDEIVSQTSKRLGSLEFPDQVGFVSFGNDQQLEQPMGLRLGPGISSEIDRSGSDIAAALRFSASHLEGSAPGGARRIVLISDGNSTEGDPVQEAKNLATAGIVVDVIPVHYEHQDEVILENVQVPETVRPGQTFSVDSVIWSSGAAEATVVLSEQDRIIERRPVQLAEGRNRITFGLGANSSPLRRLRVSVFPDAGTDSLEQNNSGLALVRTIQPPRVLIVSEDPDQTLARVLADGSILADVVAPQQMSAIAEDYLGIEAVVLDDVSAFDLDPNRIELLEKLVHSTGMGLLMVGGSDSFGAGGWRGTKVEKALPVKMDIRQRKKLPNGALAVILHTCEFAQGNLWARRIAIASLDALTEQDLFGVLLYDGGTDRWGIPMQPVADQAAIRSQIDALSPADMTQFSPTMQMALQVLLTADAHSKHVVVISDGDPPPPTQGLVDAYVQSGIRISTICIQPHPGPTGPATMKKIAQDTAGRYYFVDDPSMLPQIFFREALTVRRNLIAEGTFTPAIVEIADPIRGLASGGFPPLHGVVLTTVKPLSRLVLVNDEQDPVLALGRYGLGKTAAFTSDARARWSSDWIGWSGNSTFWSQLVRSISRELDSGVLEVSHQVEGEVGTVVIDAIDPEGRFIDGLDVRAVLVGPDLSEETLVVNQVAPGRYVGKFAAVQEGSYLLRIDHEDGQGNSGGQTKAISVGYPSEYRTLRSDDDLLRRIAEASGGRLLSGQDDLLDRSLPRKRDREPLWATLAILGLGLFFFDIVVRRVQFKIPRRGFRRRATVSVDESVEGHKEPPRRPIIGRTRRVTPGTKKTGSQPEKDAPDGVSEEPVERSEELQKLIKARKKRRKRGK
ncbi:MAG: glutamine amidotransferase [Planctomycetota bacterium]